MFPFLYDARTPRTTSPIWLLSWLRTRHATSPASRSTSTVDWYGTDAERRQKRRNGDGEKRRTGGKVFLSPIPRFPVSGFLGKRVAHNQVLNGGAKHAPRNGSCAQRP